MYVEAKFVWRDSGPRGLKRPAEQSSSLPEKKSATDDDHNYSSTPVQLHDGGRVGIQLQGGLETCEPQQQTAQENVDVAMTSTISAHTTDRQRASAYIQKSR